MNRHCLTTMFCVLLAVLLLVAPAFGNENKKDSEALYFSLIPKKNVDDQILELQPLIACLEKELERHIEIIRPQSYQSVIEGILSRTIDFAILGPASYAKARARDKGVEAFASFSGYQGFLTPMGSYYYSVLFTLKGNGYRSITDLKGGKVALTDPASTSGSVIPSLYCARDIGSSLGDFFGSLTYAGSHDLAIAAVKKHYVDAAFVSTARVDEAVRKKNIKPDEIVVLWQSQPIHSDPFVFRSGLDVSIKEQLKKAMLAPVPELDDMFKKMKMTGLVGVTDGDYRAIHEIIARENPQ